ncbi:hypothetical protein C2845_PM16G00120 [Panicum miliaceum]|uniref:B box-type domain-containing protein n=1 Tax=Panicum miliaceum TaxID=4540 RepID=A0A3L6PW53_PANMI|nr:hypothetical protein C2845_PM16G00120 [Panicum miliaceum]
MATDSVSIERIRTLLSESFCFQCPDHQGLRDSSCNLLCLDCYAAKQSAMCRWCVANHAPGHHHRFIQVRKCARHFAVRAEDLDTIIEISGMRKYIFNNSLVIYLNPRPLRSGSETNNSRGCRIICVTCARSLLLGHATFFSLRCKVFSRHIVM